ncbi:MAG TPA: MaoC family dehydratase [Burkholderiaceae bacterium]
MQGPLHSTKREQIAARVGSEIGVSDWVRIDQSMIDAFASLTGDGFFIHVDPARAALTPFGGTIAHGFLTMSLLSAMAYQVCPSIDGMRYAVNYGFNRLRFVAPVASGARVRGRFTLSAFESQPGGRWQATYQVSVEIEGGDKPALVAEWLTLAFA